MAAVAIFLVASASALLMPARPAPRATVSMLADSRSFWDKMMYGSQGKPKPEPPAAEKGPPSLKALFSQLDTNNDGELSVEELKRAFAIIRVPATDLDAIFEALCGDGGECRTKVTYDDFDARLPSSTREVFEAKLTEDGVLPSLYLPPENWIDTKTAAELRWEQKVKMQAQRSGNAMRQNDILNNELGKL